MGERHSIDAAAAHLEELTGTTPTRRRVAEGIRLELPFTDSVRDHWEQVLKIMDRGIEFGLTDTPTGAIAWMTMTTERRARP
ncbi:hypothetical protein [Streptomyces sp. NPDC048527]|uniref:hypothetical protein n=1 Tax=Streptomyces sp. NPDC048527 TaxID=3365568 RepID=UPI00371BBB45